MGAELKVLLKQVGVPMSPEVVEIDDGNPLAQLLAEQSCSGVIVERWGKERWRYIVAPEGA